MTRGRAGLGPFPPGATSRHARLAVVAALAVAVVGPACSADDGPELSYCDTLAALAAEQTPIGDESDPGELGRALDLYDHLVEVAPEEVAEEARVMADVAAIFANGGTQADFDLDAAAEASAALTESAAESCALDLATTVGPGGSDSPN